MRLAFDPRTCTARVLIAVALWPTGALPAPGLFFQGVAMPIPAPERHPAPSARLGVEGQLPALAGAAEWINTPALTPQALRGKVVLVNVWTYSCINSLRPMPYLRAWAEKYKDAGLVVIGVHSPEFEFEKASANVHRAVQDYAISFPVAVDSDHAIWRALDNQYWPAFYFVDAQGRIRHHRFGEEDYDRSERVIQQLLAEAGRTDVPSGLVSPRGEGVEAAPGPAPVLSNETYVGYARSAGPVSADGSLRDRPRAYRAASLRHVDQWTLDGDWAIERERIVLARAHGRLALRFHARDLHLVMGAKDDGQPVRFRVTLDGREPQADHGTDTDAQGFGAITSHRLYQLVRQRSNEKDRVFEIEFLDPGALAYVFTFG